MVIDEQHRDNIPGASGRPRSANQPIDLLILKLRSTSGSFTLEDRSKNTLPAFAGMGSVDGCRRIERNPEFSVQDSRKQRGTIRRKDSDDGQHGYPGCVEAAQYDAGVTQRAPGGRTGRFCSQGIGRKPQRPAAESFDDRRCSSSASPAVPVDRSKTFKATCMLDATTMGPPEALQVTGHLTGRDLTADRFRGIAIDTEVCTGPRGQQGSADFRSCPVIQFIGERRRRCCVHGRCR